MTRPATRPGRQDHVLVLCHMLSNRVSRSFAEELGKFGVMVAEWRVMLDLAANPGATGQEIANRWAMDKMAVSRAVAGLEKRGWINRRPSVRDKRSRSLELTKPGTDAYEEILPTANRHYRRLTGVLDKSELDLLQGTLLKVIEKADGTIHG